MSKIPSSLLLCYFEIAQRRLQRLTEDDPSDVHSDLSWHRSRIVEAQLTSLDEAIKNDNGVDPSVNRETVQSVLLQIGGGDFSSVSLDGDASQRFAPSPEAASTGLRRRPSGSGGGRGDDEGRRPPSEPAEDGQEQQSLLAAAVEDTNDLARRAYARSVLASAWRQDRERRRGAPQPRTGLRGNGADDDDGRLDADSALESCGLLLAAVRLPEVQGYLRDGTRAFAPADRRAGDDAADGAREDSAEDRLSRVQALYWRALGWEPVLASHQLENLLSGDGADLEGTRERIGNTPEGLETLLKYTSAMTVAATNAAMAHMGEAGGDPRNNDGTTRIVGVSYSEKIISVPTDSGGGQTTSRSLAAPAANTIDEHEVARQRQDFDVARKAAALQGHIWSEFEALPPQARADTLERAEEAQRDFLERVTAAAPGRERVLLMQSMDGEVQKLLVIYKLWCSRKAPGAE